ncbi:MAG: hypothetical protein AB7O80_00690 [Acetobacteraceae bacterium]
MAGDVASAWIAAGASMTVALISLGTAIWTNVRGDRIRRQQDETARALEELKSRLGEEKDAAKAKRDYEYDARKRLYAELYPLAFQLHETALAASNRIRNLALASGGGWLAESDDNWLTGGDPYYFHSVIHALIAPLAVYELMTRKLTLLDLTLDRDLHRLHFISRRAYLALRSDFDLVDPRYPPVEFGPGNPRYAPPETRLTTLPDPLRQRWIWRQGLYSGQVGQAVDALLLTQDGTTRVMTYAEFARALGGADLRTDDDPGGSAGQIKAALRPLSDVFRDFHPARRPVTWRILLSQAACYRAISAMQAGPASPEAIARAARFEGAPDRAAFDWIGDGTKSVPAALRQKIDFAAERDAAFAAADRFVGAALTDFARRHEHA